MDSAQVLHDLQIKKKRVSRISYVSAAIIFCIVLISGNRLLPSIQPDTYNTLLIVVAFVGLVLAYLLALKMRTLDDKIQVATVKDTLEEQLRNEGFEVPHQKVAETLAADIVASKGDQTFLIEVKSWAGLGLTVERRPETSAAHRYLVVVSSPTTGVPNEVIMNSVRRAGVEVRSAQGPSDAKKLAQELVSR